MIELSGAEERWLTPRNQLGGHRTSLSLRLREWLIDRCNRQLAPASLGCTLTVNEYWSEHWLRSAGFAELDSVICLSNNWSVVKDDSMHWNLDRVIDQCYWIHPDRTNSFIRPIVWRPHSGYLVIGLYKGKDGSQRMASFLSLCGHPYERTIHSLSLSSEPCGTQSAKLRLTWDREYCFSHACGTQK